MALRQRFPHITRFVTALVVVSAFASGCGETPSPQDDDLQAVEDNVSHRDTQQAVRGSSGAVVTAGMWSFFDIQVGDCAALVANWPQESLTGASDMIPLVPCAEPHEWQVFGLVTHPDEIFPGEASLAEFGDKSCRELLGEMIQVIDSRRWFPLLPSATGWNDAGDRTVICARSDLASAVR